MFTLGIIFLVIALIAYAVGARGTAGFSASIGRTFLMVGLILAVLFVILGFARGTYWAF